MLVRKTTVQINIRHASVRVVSYRQSTTSTSHECGPKAPYTCKAFSPNQSPLPRLRMNTGGSFVALFRFVTFTCGKQKPDSEDYTNRYR